MDRFFEEEMTDRDIKLFRKLDLIIGLVWLLSQVVLWSFAPLENSAVFIISLSVSVYMLSLYFLSEKVKHFRLNINTYTQLSLLLIFISVAFGNYNNSFDI